MKDDDALPISTPTSSSVLSSSSCPGISKRDSSSDVPGVFSRGRYKCCALAAIVLLAFWSMHAGTASLRWSAGDLRRFNEDYYSPSVAAEYLDALDLEEREKLVKHMWDLYTNSQQIGLVGFWQDAFVAAYEELTSEVPEVRDVAVSEIARMSVRYVPRLSSPFNLISEI